MVVLNIVVDALLIVMLLLEVSDRRKYARIPRVYWDRIKPILDEKVLTTDTISAEEIAFLKDAYKQNQQDIEEQMQKFVSMYAGEENQEPCAS